MLDKSKRCIATLLLATACIFTPSRAFADWPTEETATLMGWLSSINGNQQLILSEVQLIYDEFNENSNGTLMYHVKKISDKLTSTDTGSITYYLSKIADNKTNWDNAISASNSNSPGWYLKQIYNKVKDTSNGTIPYYLNRIDNNTNWDNAISASNSSSPGWYLKQVYTKVKDTSNGTIPYYLNRIDNNTNWNNAISASNSSSPGYYLKKIYEKVVQGTVSVTGGTSGGGSGADLSTIESILGNLAFVQDDGLQYLATIGNADQEFAEYLDGLNDKTNNIYELLDALTYHGTALDVYVTNPGGGTGGAADLSTIEGVLSKFNFGSGNVLLVRDGDLYDFIHDQIEPLLLKFAFYDGGILKVHDEGVYDSLSDLGTIANNIHNVVRSITGQITDIINYLQSSSTADQAIGQFDWQAYGRNAQTLTERLSAIAPFGAIALLSALIAVWSQSGAASFTPAADLPFNFLPGSNLQVHIDLSNFSSIQPVVDLFFLSMLLMALISASMRVVELEAAS